MHQDFVSWSGDFNCTIKSAYYCGTPSNPTLKGFSFSPKANCKRALTHKQQVDHQRPSWAVKDTRFSHVRVSKCNVWEYCEIKEKFHIKTCYNGVKQERRTVTMSCFHGQTEWTGWSTSFRALLISQDSMHAEIALHYRDF